MKLTFLKVISLLFIFFCSCSRKQILDKEEIEWLKNNPNLKVSSFGYFPPYLFKNQFNKVDGIFVDYLSLIEKKIDYSFEKVIYDEWSDVYKDVKEGKIDFVLDIQKTDERSVFLDFYSEFFSSEYVIVTRKKALVNYNQLTEKKIVVTKDYAIIDILNGNFKNLEINTLANDKECLMALSNGDFDLYIGAKSVVNYFIHNLNIDNLTISDTTPFIYKPSISVRKDNLKLSKIISKAVKSISQEEKEAIFNNWLFKEVKPFYRKTPFWICILSILSLLIGIIIFFNRRLKQKVKSRTVELEKAIKNVEKSNAVKTRFIQNISHEIRTPMNSILGFSELLRKENTSNEEHLDYIDTIIDSGKHLIHVIDSILEISNFRTNSAKVNLEEVHLKTIFKNIESYFYSITKKQKLKLNFNTNIQPNDTIITDKNRIKKIVYNLIDNAIKFTDEGSVDITYKLLENNSLEIEVKDTGKGIKDEDKEIIFDTFSQLENELANHYSGLGLGLTIAKENVNALEGSLTFKSKLGLGSIFNVSIPCEKVASPDISNTSKENSYTILVVEDAEINFLLVKSILERIKAYDFTILRAENGKIGVEMCEKHQHEIDLIIMDIRMPIMNGYEATKIIKEKYPNLKIVAHTAYSTDSDIQKALGVGCETVLAKPIEIELFKQTVIKYITI